MLPNGSSISDEHFERIIQKLDSLQAVEMDQYKRHLKVMSYLSDLFRQASLTPIIVGGHAVELYTVGNYMTRDIDLVLPGRDTAHDILERVGFIKGSSSRHWFHDELNIAIEIPDNVLEGSMEKVIEVETEAGYSVFVIGIEDLILDRARAGIHWDHSGDREWATYLMTAQWERIDFDYLMRTAQQDPKVYEFICEVKCELEKMDFEED